LIARVCIAPRSGIKMSLEMERFIALRATEIPFSE